MKEYTLRCVPMQLIILLFTLSDKCLCWKFVLQTYCKIYKFYCELLQKELKLKAYMLSVTARFHLIERYDLNTCSRSSLFYDALVI